MYLKKNIIRRNNIDIEKYYSKYIRIQKQLVVVMRSPTIITNQLGYHKCIKPRRTNATFFPDRNKGTFNVVLVDFGFDYKRKTKLTIHKADQVFGLCI